MESIKGNSGTDYRIIADNQDIKFEDIIDFDCPAEFKKIILFANNGLSLKALTALHLRKTYEYFKSFNPRLISNKSMGVQLLVERSYDFGAIEIDPLPFVLNILKPDELSKVEAFEDKFQTEILVNVELQAKLMKMILSFIKWVKKQERITGIIICDSGFLSEFSYTEEQIDPVKMHPISLLAKLWGRNECTIQMAIKSGKFKHKQIVKRSGSWFLSKQAMFDVFGDNSSYLILNWRLLLSDNEGIINPDKRLLDRAVKELLEFSFDFLTEDGLDERDELLLALGAKDIDKITDIIEEAIPQHASRNNINQVLNCGKFEACLMMFEQFFKHYYCLHEMESKIISKVYFKAINNTMDHKEAGFGLTSRSFYVPEFEIIQKYYRDVYLEVYGLTDREAEIDSVKGRHIGNISGSFYNLAGIENDNSNDEEEFQEVYDHLIELFFNEEYEYISNNDANGAGLIIFHVEDIKLNDKYNSPEIKKLIFKSIQEHLHYLFKMKLGCLIVNDSNFNNHILSNNPFLQEKVKRFYKKLGFKEVNTAGRTLFFHNFKYIYGHQNR